MNALKNKHKPNILLITLLYFHWYIKGLSVALSVFISISFFKVNNKVTTVK